MRDHLLDSGILIRHLRNQRGYPELVNRLSDESEIYIASFTRLEVVRGMQERAEILGGEFQLQTALGKGTVITIRVPV